MEKSISIIRIAILLSLGVIGFLFFFGEEEDPTPFAFFIHVIIDKAFACLCLYKACKLYARWRKSDPWIMAYDKWNNKVMEGE